MGLGIPDQGVSSTMGANKRASPLVGAGDSGPRRVKILPPWGKRPFPCNQAPGRAPYTTVPFPRGKNGTSTSPGPQRPPNNIWRQMLTIFFLTKSNPHSPTDQMTLSPLLQPGEGLLRVHLQLLFMPRKRQRRKGWREVCCYGFLLQQTWWCQAGGTPEKKTFFLTEAPDSWLFHATSAPSPESHQPQAKRRSTSLPLGLPPNPEFWSLGG